MQVFHKVSVRAEKERAWQSGYYNDASCRADRYTKSANTIELYEQASRDFIAADDDDLRLHICNGNVIICRTSSLLALEYDMLMDRNDYDKMARIYPIPIIIYARFDLTPYSGAKLSA